MNSIEFMRGVSAKCMNSMLMYLGRHDLLNCQFVISLVNCQFLISDAILQQTLQQMKDAILQEINATYTRRNVHKNNIHDA